MWTATKHTNGYMNIRTSYTTASSIVGKVLSGETVEISELRIDSGNVYTWGRLANHVLENNWVALKRNRDNYEFFTLEETVTEPPEETDCKLTLTTEPFGLDSGQLLFEYAKFVKIDNLKLDIIIIENDVEYELFLIIENGSKIHLQLKEEE